MGSEATLNFEDEDFILAGALQQKELVSSIPYRIEECPQLGRYLVASRDIKRGEVILKDKPLATGPIKGADLICPGCYAQEVEVECDFCGWPLCSRTCPGLKMHQELECKVLQCWNSLKIKETIDWSLLSDCLMLLRCLLLKQNSQKKWKKLLKMESNWEEWLKSPHFPSGAVPLHSILRSGFQLCPKTFSKKEIFTIQAILDINSYEVRLPSGNIQGAYPLACLMEHNCLPNTEKIINPSTYELILYATEDILEGAHISASYCDILWPTWHRQQYLQYSKFFVCTCERCRSPSEVSSNLSSLICRDCLNPALPQIPKDNPNWEKIFKNYQCQNSSCSSVIPARDAQLTLKKAEVELQELDKYADFETIPTFETWLDKWTLSKRILASVSIASISVATDDNVDERHERERELEGNKNENETSYSTSSSSSLTSQLLLHPQHSLVLDCCHTLFLLYPNQIQEEDADDDDHEPERERELLQKQFLSLRRKEAFGKHLLTATKSIFTGISKFRGTILYELAMTKASLLVNQLEGGEEEEKGNEEGGNANANNAATTNKKKTNLHLQDLAEEVIQLLTESKEMLKLEPNNTPEGNLALMADAQLSSFKLDFAHIFTITREE